MSLHIYSFPHIQPTPRCCSPSLDAETSDEEYTQDEKAANEESDVCSDFDQEEPPEDDNSQQPADINSDGEEETEVHFRTKHSKKKTNVLKVLDSDEDSDNDTVNTDHPVHLIAPPSENRADSASLFDELKGDNVSNQTKEHLTMSC